MDTAIVRLKAVYKRVVKMRYFYLLLSPVIIYFIVFHYLPIYGITLAFKDFNMAEGILKSPWAGFKHFERLFSSPSFYEVLANTVVISFLKLVFSFPAPIIFSLLLNEILHTQFKKVIQTISYLPYFISWVVLAGIIMEILSPSRGIVNYFITLFGGNSVYFLAEPAYFRAILVITHIWQAVGWGSVVYIASISSIDSEQYESAYIDGANRFQIIRYITLPSIKPVIIILFTLSLGGILNAGFDQVFNLYNPMVYKVGDILDTYVYRVGLINMDYSFSTAVGLFKNVIGLSFVITGNLIIRWATNKEQGLW